MSFADSAIMNASVKAATNAVIRNLAVADSNACLTPSKALRLRQIPVAGWHRVQCIGESVIQPSRNGALQ